MVPERVGVEADEHRAASRVGPETVTVGEHVPHGVTDDKEQVGVVEQRRGRVAAPVAEPAAPARAVVVELILGAEVGDDG